MEVAGLYIAAPHEEVKQAKVALTGLVGASHQATAAANGQLGVGPGLKRS